ncbi:SulP family inorganic anion transporter [Aureivirga marina]|uniref:SulP family inorganic anion transporter n=1 Tax=Aureivirga marina TaxID=1182451 RepID=UPI0018CBEB2A|nr:SulP family inorganic anion transporter [Aureivirga marina]
MFSTFKSDLPASIVVFFVALPLCLGIALASGAPLFSGLISGIIGGIVVGAISGSKIGVSGPAAGLAAIVLSAIVSLGSFENFLVAVVLAGAIQILFAILKAGVIGYYFPSSVIKGMLTGIGIIIIKKQIPIFFGYKTYGEFASIGEGIQMGSVIIGVVGLAILLLWSSVLSKKGKIFTVIQGPIVAVVLGILFFTFTDGSSIGIAANQLVEVPVPDSFDSFIGQFSFPNFAAIGNSEIWLVAFTMALVASLETLLCVEATDKLDPHKNVTPTNRELFAQGAGNMISGLIGGLPITQVIVRSSANIQSGGRSKMSAIMHGFFLLISVVIIPTLLNKIPLSVLAAVLLIVGYKLAKPALFVTMYKLGWKQSLPFAVTVGGIVFADLLIGIGLGLAVGVLVVLLKSYQNSHFLHEENVSDNVMKMTLAEEVTFFNKGAILKELDRVPENSSLELDVRNTVYLDHDIIEILEDFAQKSIQKNIRVKVISGVGVIDNPKCYTEVFKDTLKML